MCGDLVEDALGDGDRVAGLPAGNARLPAGANAAYEILLLVKDCVALGDLDFFQRQQFAEEILLDTLALVSGQCVYVDLAT